MMFLVWQLLLLLLLLIISELLLLQILFDGKPELILYQAYTNEMRYVLYLKEESNEYVDFHYFVDYLTAFFQ
jgi:hypothetical protein